MHKHSSQNQILSLFRPSRLIFADGDQKKTTSGLEGEKLPEEESVEAVKVQAETKKKLDKQAGRNKNLDTLKNRGGEDAKFAEAYEKGKLGRDPYRNEVFDFAFDQMFREGKRKTDAKGDNPYRELIEAVNAGYFADGHKFRTDLFRTLVQASGGKGKTRALAIDIIRGIYVNRATPSEPQADQFIVRLQAAGIDESQTPEVKGKNETELLSDNAQAIKALVIDDSEVTKQKGWPKYTPEIIPPDLELLLQKMNPLWSEANEIDKEITAKQNQLAGLEEKKKQTFSPGQRLLGEIASKKRSIDSSKQKLARMYRIIDKKSAQLSRLIGPYLEREKYRQQAMQVASKMFGIRDLKTAQHLRIPAPFLKEQDPLRADKVHCPRETIEITQVHFERTGSNTYSDDPGTMLLDFIYNGKEIKDVTMETFYKTYIQGLEAYEDITRQDLEQELGFKLTNGMELFTIQFSDREEEGTVPHTLKIEVEEITDGKDQTVIRATSLTRKDGLIETMPLSALPFSISPQFMGTRYQGGGYFTPGQFLSLIKRYGYRPSISISPETLDKATVRIPDPGESESCIWPREPHKGEKVRLEGDYDLEGRPIVKAHFPESGAMLEFPRPGLIQKDFRTNPIRTSPPERIPLEMLADLADGNKYEDLTAQPKYIKTSTPQTASAMASSQKEALTGRGQGTAGAGDIDDEDETTSTQGTATTSSATDDEYPYSQVSEETKEEEDARKKESKVKNDPSPPYSQEVLPFEQVYKTGGETPQSNFLQGLWRQTRVLSLSDIWNLGKTCYEYHDRRFRRNQQAKFSDVAKDVKYFAPEMKRINQQAENEQVNQYKEAMEQMGIWQIQDILRDTNDRDELKACFNVLATKGQIRWDDIAMWQAVNRFTASKYYIPIPTNGDPATIVDKKTGRTGMDFMELALDSMWGEGQFSGWFSENKSAYKSGIQKHYEKGKELEGVQGGHNKRLEALLYKHKSGEYVDAQEYEGLIEHSINAGKSDGEGKFYYMVEGVAAKNKYGRTIMSFDRIAHLNSEMLAKFPFLEHMCSAPGRPKDGISYKLTRDDFELWQREFDKDNSMNCKPNQHVVDFLWKNVIPSNGNITRCNKDLRNADNLDHDDMHMFLPVVTTSIITSVCQTVGGGGKELLTKEGYMNGYAGFSQYFKVLAENGKRKVLAQAVKSYVRFDSIMQNKFQRNKTGFARMDEGLMDKSVIVSEFAPRHYIQQLNPLVHSILEAYIYDLPADHPKKKEISRTIELLAQDQEEWGNKSGDQEKKDAEELTRYLNKFDSTLDTLIETDNGQKMMDLVNNADLIRYEYKPTDVKEKKKQIEERTKKWAAEG